MSSLLSVLLSLCIVGVLSFTMWSVSLSLLRSICSLLLSYGCNYCIHCDCCQHLYHHHFTHVSYIVLPNVITFNSYSKTPCGMQTSHDLYTDFCTHTHTPVPSQNLSWDAELSVPPHQVSQEAGCCQALSYPNHPNPTDQVTSWLLVVQSVQKRLPPGVRTPGWLGAVCKEMKPVQVRVSRAHPEEWRHHHHCLSLLISNSPTLNQCHIDLSTPNKSACNQKLAVIKNVERCLTQPITWDEHVSKSKLGTGSFCCNMFFFMQLSRRRSSAAFWGKHTHSHKVEGYNDTMPMKLQLMEKLLEYHAIQQANWQPSHERYIQAQFATCQSCWSLWIGVMSPCSVPKIWEPVKCFKKVYLFTPAYVQYIFPTLSRFNFIGNRRPEVILTYSDLMNPLSWNKLSSFWWLPNSPSITSLSVWRH